MSDKVDIDVKDVQETLLLPLWGKTLESQKKEPGIIL